MKNGREYWAAHVAAWRLSGMSQVVYSKRRHIAKSSLGYWSWKLKREGRAAVELVELPPARASVHEGARRAIELVVDGRYLMRIWAGTASEDIREVITALEQRS
jgi:hypothetical protein